MSENKRQQLNNLEMVLLYKRLWHRLMTCHVSSQALHTRQFSVALYQVHHCDTWGGENTIFSLNLFVSFSFTFNRKLYYHSSQFPQPLKLKSCVSPFCCVTFILTNLSVVNDYCLTEQVLQPSSLSPLCHLCLFRLTVSHQHRWAWLVRLILWGTIVNLNLCQPSFSPSLENHFIRVKTLQKIPMIDQDVSLFCGLFPKDLIL